MKVKTLADIKAHPLVDDFIKDFDTYGKHMVALKEGYRFENTDGSCDFGNVKELCDSLNNHIIEFKP